MQCTSCSEPRAETHRKGGKEVRAILNSAPAITKKTTTTRQRWSVTRHRRANLPLVRVNDKPPFNRRLCVRNPPPPSPSISPPLPSLLGSQKQSGKVALPSSCRGGQKGRGWGGGRLLIWPEKERQVGGSPSTRQRRDAGPCGGGGGGRAGRLVRGRPGVAAVWAGRAEPSTRRDLGWLLWKETRQESGGGDREREGERGGREILTDYGGCGGVRGGGEERERAASV